MEKENLSIKNWAEEDRPREKALSKGISVLSNAELLAILIGSGNKNQSAVELSKCILASVDNNLENLGRLQIKDLEKGFLGIGEAKAISIVSALELGKRRKLAEVRQKKQIKSSEDSGSLFIELLSDLPHEEFWVLLLNRSNKIIDNVRISSGGINETTVDVRMILKIAVEKLASGIIVCHNHPSGNIFPGANDKQITEKLKQAVSFFDIRFLDHIIVSGKKYYSFADEGLL